MARLGNKPIQVPQDVKIEVKSGCVYCAGPKGKLETVILSGLSVSSRENQVFVKNEVSEKERKLFKKVDAFQGLLRTLILNMIEGVSKGFEKILEIHGVGYKAEIKEKELILALGHSHPVVIDVPEDISMEIVRNTVLFIRGIDKRSVGNIAAKIRKLYPPEPYKGKGIRYRGEYVRQKVGKTAVGAT